LSNIIDSSYDPGIKGFITYFFLKILKRIFLIITLKQGQTKA